MKSAFWLMTDTPDGEVYEDIEGPIEVRHCLNDTDYPIEISGQSHTGQRVGLALTPVDCIKVLNKLYPAVTEIIG
jgi:hypothetical protein